MPEPKALEDLIVGDRFWLATAQEAVKGAIKAPEDRAAQLTTAIGWFWTVYSSAGLLAIALAGDRLGVWHALLIAVPSLVLIVAYSVAGSVGRPLLFDFDPRVPAEIAQAHGEAALAKRRALKRAERWALLGAVAVVAGLAGAIGLVPRAQGTSLAARINPADRQQVLVLAEVPANAVVTFNAVVAAAGGASSSAAVLQRSDDSGTARAMLPLPAAGTVRVTASWTSTPDGIERTMSVTLKP